MRMKKSRAKLECQYDSHFTSWRALKKYVKRSMIRI